MLHFIFDQDILFTRFLFKKMKKFLFSIFFFFFFFFIIIYTGGLVAPPESNNENPIGHVLFLLK